MSGIRTPLAVNGALRVVGPGGPVRLRADGDRIEVTVPGLLEAWRLGRSSRLNALQPVLETLDLSVRVLVRRRVIAEAGAAAPGGMRVRWGGVLGACLTAPLSLGRR